MESSGQDTLAESDVAVEDGGSVEPPIRWVSPPRYVWEVFWEHVPHLKIRFRFRRRYLLVIPVLLSMAAAWVGYQWNHARRETAAVASLTANGMEVIERGPAWLREMLGVHFPVVTIRMDYHEPWGDDYHENAFLRDIEQLTELRTIEVYGRWWKWWLREEAEQRANGELPDEAEDPHSLYSRVRRVNPSVRWKMHPGRLKVDERPEPPYVETNLARFTTR